MSYATKDQLKSIMADAASKTKTAVGGKVSEALLKDTVGWTGKNLLDYRLYRKSHTYKGFTVTVNDDGTVRVQGKVNGEWDNTENNVNKINIAILDKGIFPIIPDTIVGKQLILSGCPDGGGIGKYAFDFWWTGVGFANFEYGNGRIINVPSNVNELRDYNIKIVIMTEDEVDLTFKPMLRRADITDDTYEPYHESVEGEIDSIQNQLTDSGKSFRFGVDSNGNYGYYKDGADTVTPFKNPTGTKEDTYTENGVYTVDVTDNASHKITIDVSTAKTYNYGFHIDASNSDPSASVTYLEDAVGMTPAHMDYGAAEFDYGSWEDAFFMPRPCMVKSNGTVDYYLDPNDYTKKVDGSSSDVANTSYDGNAMIEWGQNGQKIYYKVVPSSDGNSADVYISNTKVDDNYHDYPFINYKGKEVDHFYTPIYNGSLIDSKLRSLSGQQVSNKTTAEQEVNYAKANNPGSDEMWNIDLTADRILINFLLILMGKSLDTQTVFGQGLHTSGTETINNSFRTGVHNDKGLFYGTNSGAAATYTNAVKVFGMENWFGFQWRRMLGWINDSGTQKVKLDSTNGYNLTGDGYTTVANATPAGTSGGYINKVKFTDSGIMVPYQASGSETTYFCDGLYFNNSGVKVALVGGHSALGARVGAFSSALFVAASYSDWGRGAALSLKPLA